MTRPSSLLTHAPPPHSLRSLLHTMSAPSLRSSQHFQLADEKFGVTLFKPSPSFSLIREVDLGLLVRAYRDEPFEVTRSAIGIRNPRLLSPLIFGWVVGARFPHGRAIAKIVSIELLECNRSGTVLTLQRELWRRGFQFDSDYSGGWRINTFL